MVNSRNIESQGRNSNRRLSNHFVKKEDREEVRVDAVELYNSLWSGCRLQLRVHRELGTTVTKAQAFHISKHPQRIKGWSREILRTDTQPHMTYRKNTTAFSCRSERNIHSKDQSRNQDLLGKDYLCSIADWNARIKSQYSLESTPNLEEKTAWLWGVGTASSPSC